MSTEQCSVSFHSLQDYFHKNDPSNSGFDHPRRIKIELLLQSVLVNTESNCKIVIQFLGKS